MKQESKQIAQVLLNTEAEPMKHLSPCQENDFLMAFFKENSHWLQWGEDLAEEVYPKDHQLMSVASHAVSPTFAEVATNFQH